MADLVPAEVADVFRLVGLAVFQDDEGAHLFAVFGVGFVHHLDVGDAFHAVE